MVYFASVINHDCSSAGRVVTAGSCWIINNFVHGKRSICPLVSTRAHGAVRSHQDRLVIPGANPGSSSPSFHLHIRADWKRGVISAGRAGNSRLNNLARGDCARVGSPSAPTERRCDFRAVSWSPDSLSPSRPVPARVSGARRWEQWRTVGLLLFSSVGVDGE